MKKLIIALVIVVCLVGAGIGAYFIITNNDDNGDTQHTYFTLTYLASTGGWVQGNTTQQVRQFQDGLMVTAIANSGWHFTGWSDGRPDAMRMDIIVNSNVTVTAQFAQDVTTPQVLSVSISSNFTNLNVGQTYQLNATVNVVGGASQIVDWTSSDTAVATVDSMGFVTALAGGTTTITARSQFDSTQYDTSIVTVNQSAAIISIEVAPTSTTLNVGNTQQFTATVVAVGGAVTSVTWSSSNPAVATVSISGVVTAHSVGTATITATSDFYTAPSASATVTVSSAQITPEVTDVTVTPTTTSLYINGTQQLTPTVIAVGGASQLVEWTSSNPSTASVDANGLVTAHAVGTATITVRSQFNNLKYATAVITVQAQIVNVTVSFVTGTAQTFPPITRPHNQTYGTLPSPSRDNHTFEGWWTTPSTGGQLITSASTVTNATAHNLYARWEPVVVNNGHNIISINNSNITRSGQTLSMNVRNSEITFSVIGAFTFSTGSQVTFTGVNTTVVGATINLNPGMNTVTITVVASDFSGQSIYTFNIYRFPMVTVNFMNQASVHHTQSVEEQQTFNAPTTPERTGYNFGGWYTNSNFTGSPITFPHLLAQATTLTLHARWTAITYTIQYNANGGSGGMQNTSHEFGVSQNLRLNTFTSNVLGHRFSGWNTQADGSGESFTDGQPVLNLTSIGGTVIHLFAQWELPVTYSVTFNANGGVGNMTPSQHTFNVSSALTSNSFTRDNHIFIGWSLTSSGGVEFTNTQQVMNLSSTHGAIVTLYAVWNEIPSGFTQITTSAQLRAMTRDGNYILMNDINLNNTNWIPIFRNDGATVGIRELNRFNGTFNGGGFTITNFRVNTMVAFGSTYYVGFFGYIDMDGIVKNLTLSNFTFNNPTGTTPTEPILHMGGLAARNRGTIVNVHIIADMQSNLMGPLTGFGTRTMIQFGGLVGQNNVTGVILRSSVSGDIDISLRSPGGRVYIGGMVASNFGVINSSSSDVKINGAITQTGSGQGSIASFPYVGGFVARNGQQGANPTGFISNSFAIGNITLTGASAVVGGFVGGAYASNHRSSGIRNAFTSGNILVTTSFGGAQVRAGGFVGELGRLAHIANSFASGTITSNVVGTATNSAGTFIGHISSLGEFSLVNISRYSGQTISTSGVNSTNSIGANGTARAVGVINTTLFPTLLGWSAQTWNMNNLDFANGVLPTLTNNVTEVMEDFISNYTFIVDNNFGGWLRMQGGANVQYRFYVERENDEFELISTVSRAWVSGGFGDVHSISLASLNLNDGANTVRVVSATIVASYHNGVLTIGRSIGYWET